MMAVILLPGMEYLGPDELELDNGRELFFNSDLIFLEITVHTVLNPTHN